MKTIKLEEFNQDTFTSATIDKVILSFGSTECHGDHLPYGCDTFVSYDIACSVAEKLNDTVAAPPVWYGMSGHYAHKPMCISLSDDTLILLIKDMLSSLINWGIRKVFIVNGHDGNIAAIDIATRQLKVSHPDFRVAVLDAWWVAAGNLLPSDTFEADNGLGHGGEAETSIGLALFPELCNMDKARGMVPSVDQNVKLVWNFDELTEFGATGRPELATPAKGEKMKSALVDYIVNFIGEMDKSDWRFPTR